MIDVDETKGPAPRDVGRSLTSIRRLRTGSAWLLTPDYVAFYV